MENQKSKIQESVIEMTEQLKVMNDKIKLLQQTQDIVLSTLVVLSNNLGLNDKRLIHSKSEAHIIIHVLAMIQQELMYMDEHKFSYQDVDTLIENQDWEEIAQFIKSVEEIETNLNELNRYQPELIKALSVPYFDDETIQKMIAKKKSLADYKQQLLDYKYEVGFKFLD